MVFLFSTPFSLASVEKSLDSLKVVTYSNWGPVDGARFGLADTVDKAVSDYYDLLFDNVADFISMNREELQEYEAEDVELRKKLEDISITSYERKTLLESREKNSEQIEQLREFINSDRILEVGIKFSGDVLDDGEPEFWRPTCRQPTEALPSV